MSKVTLSRREMKARQKENRRSRTRTSSMLGRPETSDAQRDGEKDAAVTVKLSAGKPIAHGNATSTKLGRPNSKPLRGEMHTEELLHQRRLPPPQDCPIMTNSKPLMRIPK